MNGADSDFVEVILISFPPNLPPFFFLSDPYILP
jgi:hypothetical protein